MFFQRITRLVLVFCVISSPAISINSPAKSNSRWEADIRAFENWDAKNSFPEDSVLFVGSSSIRMWKTRQSFPDIDVINRGFGGSQISDSIELADRIILGYKPALIIFYAGDNDIAGGKTPDHVLGDYKTLVKIIHASLPRTPVIFMSIKPSKSRWTLWPKMRKTNMLIKDFSKSDNRLFYVDGATPFLASDGKPDDKYFLSDKLHLSDEGYTVWAKLLEPINVLNKIDPDKQVLSDALIKKGMGPHNAK